MAVRWQVTAGLFFCAIYIVIENTGAKRLSLKHHSTWQSSTVYSGYSKRAIDGKTHKTYMKWTKKSCTYTKNKEAPAWWAVDLGKTYVIEKVVVYSRDSYRERSANYVVRVTERRPPLKDKADLDTFRTCGKHRGKPPLKSEVNCAPGTRGRYLYIQIPGKILTLCEVVVYGKEPVCGKPTTKPLMFRRSRIINGWEARPHSWPWLATLMDAKLDAHFCAGVILDELYILTAAHCVVGSSPWVRATKASERRVLLGVHDLNDTTETRQTRFANVIIHSGYDKWSHDNDIALLKLTEPITFTSEISPICLPEGEGSLQPGEVCYVAGWGRTESDARSNRLQQTDAPIIAQDLCNSTDWYDGEVLPNMVCAGFEEGTRDSCSGDSGGPLMYKDRLWYSLGIVSWGHGCAMEKHPGVYVRVAKYLDWIKQHM